jgi:hypothetical protein
MVGVTGPYEKIYVTFPNMDWADVKEAAVLVSEPGVPPGVPPGVSIDYERSWSSVHTEFAARTGAA